jgi:hypothetical protein
MKAIIGVMAGLLLAAGVANGAITSSVATGGDWTDTLTWSTNRVPGPGDSVQINGTVIIPQYSNAQCNDLIISSTGILENTADKNLGLQVYGGITNNGIIRDNPASSGVYLAYLAVAVKKNVVNNGTMSQYRLDFNGDSGSTQQLGGTQTFSCKNILISSKNGRLAATSALVFDTLADFNLSGDTLSMGSYTFTAQSKSSANVHNGTINTNGQVDVSGPFGCDLVGNVSITGSQPMMIANVGFTGGGIWAKGSITVASGKIVEAPTFYGYTWQIIGDLTNNGTIQDNPAGNHLMVNITGNLVNNGTMSQYVLTFNGDSTAQQHLGGTQKFDCRTINKSVRGHLTATSALVFDSLTTLDLADDTLDMGSFAFTARSTQNSNVHNGAITTNGQVDVSGPFGSTIIGNASITGSQPMMIANVGFTGGGISAKGSITVASGKIVEVPNYYGYTWQIIGDLTNNGTIQDNPAGNHLTVNITGNLVNNGTMSQYRLTFNGDSTVLQKLGGTQKFDCATINKSVHGRLAATSALVFDTLTTFDLSNDTLDMDTFALTIRSTDNANFSGGIIRSVGKVDVSGLFGSNLMGNMELCGSKPMQIANIGSTGGGLTVYGNIIVDSGKTVQVPAKWGYSLTVTGDVINNGTIRNNPAGNQLSLGIGGDICNNGIWTNQKTTLNGAHAQKIMLTADKAISSPVTLASASGNSGPYQWYKNNSVLSGATSATYSLDSVTTAAYGIYKCSGDSAFSRTITIMQGGVGVIRDSRFAGSSPGKPDHDACSFVRNANGAYIHYQLAQDNMVSLKIVTVSGRSMTLLHERKSAGFYRFSLDRCGLAAGVYAIRFEAGRFSAAKLMPLAR